MHCCQSKVFEFGLGSGPQGVCHARNHSRPASGACSQARIVAPDAGAIHCQAQSTLAFGRRPEPYRPALRGGQENLSL